MIPLAVNILRPLDCTSTWLATGLTCWSGAHLGLVAAGVAIFAVFALITLARM